MPMKTGLSSVVLEKPVPPPMAWPFTSAFTFSLLLLLASPPSASGQPAAPTVTLVPTGVNITTNGGLTANSVAYSPDGTVLAVGQDSYVVLRDTTTWTVQQQLPSVEPGNNVRLVKYSTTNPQDLVIVVNASVYRQSTRTNATTVLWRPYLYSSSLMRLLELQPQLSAMVASDSGNVTLCSNCPGGAPLSINAMPSQFAIAFNATNTSELFVGGLWSSGQGGLKRCNVQSRTCSPPLPQVPVAACTSLAMAPDGTLAAGLIAGNSTMVQLLLPGGGTRLFTGCHQAGVRLYTLAISSDARFVASGGSDGSLCVWDTRSPGNLTAATYQLSSHLVMITAIAFNPSKVTELVSVDTDHVARQWQLSAVPLPSPSPLVSPAAANSTTAAPSAESESKLPKPLIITVACAAAVLGAAVAGVAAWKAFVGCGTNSLEVVMTDTADEDKLAGSGTVPALPTDVTLELSEAPIDGDAVELEVQGEEEMRSATWRAETEAAQSAGSY